MATTEACVLHGAKDLRLETIPLPPPGPTSLQVAILRTGLCGSDLHYYRHFRNGDIRAREPFALGHESAGIVTAIGASVAAAADFHVGDRVALEVGLPCARCARCSEGRYNICPTLRFGSSAKRVPHAWGTLQGRVNHPAQWCWKLPPGLTLDHGALLEPFSVALHALDRAGLGKGGEGGGTTEGSTTKRTALIFGAGAVGALVAAALRFQEPDVTVLVADVDEKRAQFVAANRFAHRGWVVPMKPLAETMLENLMAAKNMARLARSFLPDGVDAGGAESEAPHGYDVVFECTGKEVCLQGAIYAAREGGKVLMIGMGTPVQELPIGAAALREVDLLGVFRYHHTYERGIALLAKAQRDLEAGKDVPDVTRLITHRVLGLRDAHRAFELASQPVDGQGRSVLKVVVEAAYDG